VVTIRCLGLNKQSTSGCLVQFLVKGLPDCLGKIYPKFLLDLVSKVGDDEQATKLAENYSNESTR
jgi:hypothetical protein